MALLLVDVLEYMSPCTRVCATVLCIFHFVCVFNYYLNSQFKLFVFAHEYDTGTQRKEEMRRHERYIEREREKNKN